MGKKKIHLKLNHKNGALLKEDAYTDFAVDVNWIMRSLYSGPAVNAKIQLGGSPDQIMAFFNALQGEKRYMDAYLKNGLDSAGTMTSKHDLDRSIRDFEFETGLKWPFKN
ncbi:MAG: hypothetical protein HN566_12580 [Polaribacter sp.]|jgi:hypothetical protein|nr:hypothetical protein [Polaribacter sp.]